MSFDLVTFYKNGGPLMYPILAVLIFATSQIIKQYLNLTYYFTVNDKFFGKIKLMIKDEKVQEAYHCCLTTSHPLSKVLVALIYNSNKNPDIIKSAANIEKKKILPYIHGSSTFILMSGRIALTLGLIGTLYAFSQTNTFYGEVLNPLILGLVVSIPCTISSIYFGFREKLIVKKYDELMTEVIHLIIFKPFVDVVNVDAEIHKYRKYGT